MTGVNISAIGALSTGTISSPGYSRGQDYDNDSRCAWIITFETGNLKLKFADAFDMEKG